MTRSIGRCNDLVPFVDGELDSRRTEAFRSHLVNCGECQSELVEAVQFSVRLRDLTPGTRVHTEKPTAWAHARRPRAAWSGAIVLSAVATIAMIYCLRPQPDAFEGIATRPLEIRFAYSGAAKHRPHNTTRGSGGAVSRERISRSVMAELEKRDRHTLAIATAWNGDNLGDALHELRNLEPTPSVQSDIAAIELLTTKNDNMEGVLAKLEVLRKGSDVAARAARWNYAVLLSRLGLPLTAAAEFTVIADEREPGWADEAGELAARNAQVANVTRENYQRAQKAGQDLVATGTPVSSELVKLVPGVLRAYFYNAVRTVPSADRVRALAPIAADLDRLGDQHTLSDYVAQVAQLDFRLRRPLADAYAKLLAAQPITPQLKHQLTTPTDVADISDIVLGAMVERDINISNPKGFAEMVKRTRDPWFSLVLAQSEAAAAKQRNAWLDAETTLRGAHKWCTSTAAAASTSSDDKNTRGLTYQCLVIANDLGALYADLHRVTEAIEVLDSGVRLARSAGEWLKARQLLWRLADVERLHSSTATARAYANEVLRMADDCPYKAAANRTLTGAALLDGDGVTARHHFEEALACGKPDLVACNYLTDIGRLDPHPDDVQRLQGWLTELRDRTGPSPAQRALTDEIEGRLVIERDRAAGAALLWRAIRFAETLTDDVTAMKARSGAFSVLVVDAASHGDYRGALALIAEDLGLPAPEACAVGMLAEAERSIVLVRGVDGTVRAEYEGKRPPRAGPPTVPFSLAQSLTGCGHIRVLAQAALQGKPRVLPPELPWSYMTGARRKDVAPVASGDEQRLVVTDVIPPPELHLPTLSANNPTKPSGSTRLLSGMRATPSAVLDAIRDANEIQFHTHALVDMGISDASYLVLSPEPGRYALTVENLRGAELRRQPLVVLAACHSAQGAPYQHAPWSLPHAFLSIGARGVFAAATEIPDIESGPFFARVLRSVSAGIDPAVALRDERVAHAAANPWIADVILFE